MSDRRSTTFFQSLIRQIKQCLHENIGIMKGSVFIRKLNFVLLESHFVKLSLLIELIYH